MVRSLPGFDVTTGFRPTVAFTCLVNRDHVEVTFDFQKSGSRKSYSWTTKRLRGLLKIPHAQVSDYGARWIGVVFTRPDRLDSVNLGRGAVRGRSIRFSFLLRTSTRRLDLKIVQSPTERAGRHQAIGGFRITVVVAERESV